MEGNQRRTEILTILIAAEKPVSASSFAKKFGVSRQIVVGDVALLRASGADIIATARGYVMNQVNPKKTAKIAVQHNKNQTELELTTIIENGGEILDVVVEHPLYGELVGQLQLTTLPEVSAFIQTYQKLNAGLLSELTDGIHLHTIAFEEDSDLEKIKQALKAVGILYESSQE